MAKALGFLLLFAQVSLQQQIDTVNNFCRRFGHQSCVIDRKLYIDGGQLNANPVGQNFTNTWESYHDLDTSPPGINMPQLHASLSKNASIPDVSGGVLWADDVNKRYFLYGGESFQGPPSAANLISYDIINDKWDSFGPPSQSIQSVAWGAGVTAHGAGYLLGGWMNNNSVPGWGGVPLATSYMVKYDMDKQSWTNVTGPPDNTPRAEGVMVYVPNSDSGMLVHFGGVTVNNNNGSFQAAPMEQINLYDIKSGKWYQQTASGQVPPTRRRFCAGAAWAADQSSYNIYIYGGLGFGASFAGYQDVWILSLPSFKWIPYYQGGATDINMHHSLTCNVVGGQMLVIGGTFPMNNDCDNSQGWGVHNLDMGKVSGKQWNDYHPNLTTYSVPPDVISVVGGTPTGSATLNTPDNGFANPDLQVYFQQKATPLARTPTRAIPAASATSSSAAPSGKSSSGIKLSGAAIAGIAVGAAILLSTLILGGCFLIRQKRNNKRQMPPPLVIPRAAPDYSQTPFSPQSQYSHVGTFKPAPHYQLPTEPEPVELYGSNYRLKGDSKEISIYHHLRESQHPTYKYSKPPPPQPRHGGSPTSTYSDSGTHFSGSNTLYGSPPTPVYHNLGKSPPSPPPPMPHAPPGHF